MFYNEQAEKILLGKLVTEPQENESYIYNLNEQDFYNKFNQSIFKQLKKLLQSKKEIDILTISDTFQNNDEAFEYLAEISDVAVLQNTATHFKIVKEKSCRRQILKVLQESMNQLKDADIDIDSIKDELVRKTNSIELKSSTTGKDARELVVELLEEMQSIKNGDKKNIQEYLTGIKKLDLKTSGYQRGEITLIAAYPGTGKTSFMLQTAFKITRFAKRPLKILIVSLEMSKQLLLRRMVGNTMKINIQKIKNGNVDDSDIEATAKYYQMLGEHEIIIDDKIKKPGEIRNLQRKENFDIIFVDYIQRMSSDYMIQGKNNEIGDISGKLTSIAKDYNIPVVALSQFSRPAKNTNPRPRMSDLRDSGNLEQDADNIIILFDPEPTKRDVEFRNYELIIEKQRNGGVGIYPIRFVPKYTKFENLEV